MELISLIQSLTEDNNAFIKLLDDSIKLLEDEDNEKIQLQNKKISNEILNRESNYTKFKELMAEQNISKVEYIPAPENMSKEEFDLIINNFRESVVSGKQKMEEYFKAFSIEYNMINKIKTLGRKNKLNIKF